MSGRFGIAVDPGPGRPSRRCEVGDVVSIGSLELDVRAVITEQPDRNLTAGWRASPIMISEEALNADRPGFTWQQDRVRIPSPNRLGYGRSGRVPFFEEHPDTTWEVSTFLDRSNQVGERLAQAGSALLIVGFSTLFVGGLGVFNSVQAYLQAKAGNHSHAAFPWPQRSRSVDRLPAPDPDPEWASPASPEQLLGFLALSFRGRTCSQRRRFKWIRCSPAR